MWPIFFHILIKMTEQYGFVREDHSAIQWLDSACDRGFLLSTLMPEKGWCTIEKQIFDLWQLHVKIQPIILLSKDRVVHKVIDEDVVFIPEDGAIYEWIDNAINEGFLQAKCAPDDGWCKLQKQAMILWDAHVKVNPNLAQPDERKPLWANDD
jgi:hypothetical protein